MITDNEIIKDLEKRAKKLSTYPNNIFKLSLDLINRQKEKIDDLERIVGLMNKRKYYRKFVDEVFSKQKGKELSTPDFDYIYELYFEQRAEIKRLSTLSKLGNMRANDYRAMRDRALKAEKEVDRLSQVVLYNDGVTEMKVTEAVEKFAKKFVKKLKEHSITRYDDRIKEYSQPYIHILTVKKIAKEMVGEYK